ASATIPGSGRRLKTRSRRSMLPTSCFGGVKLLRKRRPNVLHHRRRPPPPLSGVTSLVYALHGLSIVIGLVTAAAVITAFVLGWPSIIAVIINYVKRSEARGTYLEQHLPWQI